MTRPPLLPPFPLLAALFGTGLSYGGPVVCLWGWLFASACNMSVALGMAELASAYPTSGMNRGGGSVECGVNSRRPTQPQV